MPNIEKVFVKNVISLDEHTSCADAAHLMAKRRIGSVGVTRAGRLFGLVTERDLVYGVMAEGRTGATEIGELVRNEVPPVTPRATERDCAHLMRTHATRHLLVKEGDDAVGVVSMLDVVSLMLDDNRWLIEQLHTYIKGGRGG